MIRSHTITTVPADKLELMRTQVAETEAYYEAEYPGFDCEIKIVESDPNEHGVVAFRLSIPDGCGPAGVRDIVDLDLLEIDEAPAVFADELAANPYCLSDDSFWVESGHKITWHYIGDEI